MLRKSCSFTRIGENQIIKKNFSCSDIYEQFTVTFNSIYIEVLSG